MTDASEYPVDPMAAFYAAVTAVENGSVGEVELEFRKETHTENETLETVITMSIRREVRPTSVLMPIPNQKEE